MDLKISVLESGTVLLDGKTVGLAELAAALNEADPAQAVVRYHRENPSGTPPPQATEVMRLITAHRLPVSFSTQPNFSDPVELTSGTAGLTLLTPDGRMAAIPLPPESAQARKRAKQLPPLFSGDGARRLAVIASTSFVPAGATEVDLLAANQAIPFLGFLVGYASCGHNVCVFDAQGQANLFEAGVAGADTLLIDGALFDALPADWMAVARQAMQPGCRVYRHNRDHFNLERLVSSAFPPGWRQQEPEGEGSFVNCVLTLLAKSHLSPATVTVSSGQPLPRLQDLTNDPEELDWIAGLPFDEQKEELDARVVIAALVGMTGGVSKLLRSEWRFQPMLVASDGTQSRPVYRVCWKSRFPQQVLEITCESR